VSESEIPQNNSGTGLYLIGALLLAGGAAGIYFATRDDAPPPAAATTIASAKPPEPMQEAPPPPPPPPPPTATESASAAPADTGAKPVGTGGGGGVGACSACGQGVPSSALSSALQSAAGSAQGCYKRALRNTAASGRITVAVSVGATGQVCSASIANDTLGSPEISSCVLSRFQGKSFPRPEQGCVVVNIPINFKLAE
jgi:outer membrane biosynthesis protein TonB